MWLSIITSVFLNQPYLWFCVHMQFYDSAIILYDLFDKSQNIIEENLNVNIRWNMSLVHQDKNHRRAHTIEQVKHIFAFYVMECKTLFAVGIKDFLTS